MAKVLIAELPWLKPSGESYKFAGRSGMRWAYTSEKEPIVSFRPFPFGMAYTSALFEKTNHDEHIMDALAEGQSLEEFLNEVIKIKPDFIICETHTPSYENDRKIVAEIKKRLPFTKIVFCGPHATALPDEVLEENKGIVDNVLVGGYEHLAVKLVDGQVHDKKITMNDLIDKKIFKKEPNIDEYPWPDRDGLLVYNYNETFCDNYLNIHILASRGCPYSCSYCNVSLMSGGRRIRYRNPLDVVEEMKYCIKRFEPKEFWFEDDIINANEQRFKNLMSTICQADLDIPFKAMGHVNISRSALELFKVAGGNGIKFGIESVDNNVLKRLRKGITFDMIQRTLQNCDDLGIKTHLTYCIGLPGDTEETIRKTIKFAKKNGTTYQISLAAPFPGTPLYEEAKKEGWTNFKSWNDFDGMNKSTLNYPNLSSKKIYKLYKSGQESTYRKIIKTGEWKKYLRMIHQERGTKGLLKLLKRMDIIKSILKP